MVWLFQHITLLKKYTGWSKFMISEISFHGLTQMIGIFTFSTFSNWCLDSEDTLNRHFNRLTYIVDRQYYIYIYTHYNFIYIYIHIYIYTYIYTHIYTPSSTDYRCATLCSNDLCIPSACYGWNPSPLFNAPGISFACVLGTCSRTGRVAPGIFTLKLPGWHRMFFQSLMFQTLAVGKCWYKCSFCVRLWESLGIGF